MTLHIIVQNIAAFSSNTIKVRRNKALRAKIKDKLSIQNLIFSKNILQNECKIMIFPDKKKTKRLYHQQTWLYYNIKQFLQAEYK